MDFDCSNITKRRKSSNLIPIDVTKNDDLYSEFEQNYAEGYLAQLEETLDKYSYIKIMNILNESFDVVELYKTLSEILEPYPDLLSGFLLCLYPGQAFKCGKIDEYLRLSQMIEFWCKLNAYFKKCPQQIRKIIDCLYYLSIEPNISSETVRTTVMPLLKNNTSLADSFLQLLPNEKPPDSLFTDNWEDVNIDSGESDSEEITEIPKFGDSTLDAAEDNHCLTACTKENPLCCTFHNVNFINGRVYVQKGKILRPAKLIFEGINQDDRNRLMTKREVNIPKCGSKGHKKSEIINIDSACTESDEERSSSMTQKRKKRLRKSANKRKIEMSEDENKADQIMIMSEDNTDGETELSDDYMNVSEQGTSLSRIRSNSDVTGSLYNDECFLLKRPDICDSELVLTTSDAPLMLDNINN